MAKAKKEEEAKKEAKNKETETKDTKSAATKKNENDSSDDKADNEKKDEKEDNKNADAEPSETKPADPPTESEQTPSTAPNEETQQEGEETQGDAVGGEGDNAINDEAAAGETEEKEEEKRPSKPIKLYKSSRLKGYLTILLASIINFNAADKSDDVIAASGAIPPTQSQRVYAITVSIISLILTGFTVLVHLDTLTPLEKVWISFFKPKSNVELFLCLFLVLWWSVATGVQTAIGGIAGDGKEQYSLYFSSWVCTFASFWVLERWWVASGLSSLKAFITSWPYRSPGWLCIFFMSCFALIWYLNLWQSHDNLDRPIEASLLEYFESVPEIQWDLLITISIFTIVPAAAFVLAEIFRETKPDGSNQEKGATENRTEGACLLALIVLWIPMIIWITAPGGAASLPGNAYFSSWLLVIFIAETGVWFVHDLRERIHQSLEQKQLEYREKQRQVVEKARAVQQQKKESPVVDLQQAEDFGNANDYDDDDNDNGNDESSNEDYMDALADL